MTLEKLAQMISRGFAAIADGQDAIASELRANRIHFAKVKGQRHMDQEAHEADLNALGTQVAAHVSDHVRHLTVIRNPAAQAATKPGPAE